MATIVKWDGYAFSISAKKVIGLKDFDVSLSIETEKKTKSKENFQKKKNLNPAKITLTGIFSMALGVDDVQGSALQLADKCRKGDSGYIYVGTSKLMPPKFMGTNAKITKMEWLPDGRWSYAEVNITLEQCEKYGGGTSGGKKKKKSSTKKKSTKSSKGTSKSAMSTSSYNERKKQLEQAKQNAKATVKGGAAASIKSKLQAAGKTVRATGTARGTWRAMTR